MKRPTPEQVEREIAALDTLDIAALRSRWRDLYKTEPPAKVRSGFLRQAIAYRLQELTFGGLKPSVLRQLRKLAEPISPPKELTGTSSSSSSKAAVKGLSNAQRVVLSPGTRLMREWAGSTELVEVLETGFGWRGKSFRTLSAVAGAITGTKWSGPKFFGLRNDHRRPDGGVRTRGRFVSSVDQRGAS